MKNRVWLYCRVGNPNQLSLEGQKRHLIQFAKEHECDIVGVTAEFGSGVNYEREGLQALLSSAKSRAMDKVLVCNFSRLVRDTGLLCKCIEELQKSDVEIVSATDGIDTSGVLKMQSCLLDHAIR